GSENSPAATTAVSKQNRKLSLVTLYYFLTILFFLIAIAGKQSVVLLPGLLLFWDILLEKRRSLWMLLDKVPFGLITVFVGWMTWHAQPSTRQATSFFVYAQTELTNLWLLTGCGKYALYRPKPNPANWNKAVQIGSIVAGIVVWVVPFLLAH